jgi:chromosome segregation protein
MHGFKSFARKTEIPFENAMNVIVGPNGSGKSNITDALCFVLGRTSIKSIRAAKSANLIFSGNKQFKPANEASVELVFNNDDKTFSLDHAEIIIKRTVKRNGLSVYRINGEVKTRQEVVELMAQAGIDSQGLNIVLQGEIASFVKMNPDERRKVIEEVADISIYETRKHKSLLELEKAEANLKEVSTILKEKNAHLRNLEKEKQEVLDYQKLEETIKRCEATLLKNEIKIKEEELKNLEKSIQIEEEKSKIVREKIASQNEIINQLEEKITFINKKIQSSTSTEQEVIHKELSNLKAEIARLQVRKENFESRISQNIQKVENMKNKLATLEKEMSEIKGATPEIKKQQTELKVLQEKFDLLEKQRRKFYVLKSELSTLENKRDEKEKAFIENKRELELIERTIDSLVSEIKYAKTKEKAEVLKSETTKKIREIKEEIENLNLKILELEKTNAVISQTIQRERKLKGDIVGLETCPLCRSQITTEHKNHVSGRADEIITKSLEGQEKNEEAKQLSKARITELKNSLEELERKVREIEIDIMKINNAEERKEQIKKLMKNQEENRSIYEGLTARITSLKKEIEPLNNIEEKYDETRIKMQEYSFADIDVSSEISMKQRESEKLKVEIKAIERDTEETKEELAKITEIYSENQKVAKRKEEEERIIYERFQQLFEEKNELQDQQKAIETTVMGFQHEIKNYDMKIGNYNIEKAQKNAQMETFVSEFEKYPNLELIKAPIAEIRDRLTKAKMRIGSIGNINMRALEVYEQVKKSVDLITEKVQTIENEKNEIMSIISEIDKKKKKSFLMALEAVNNYFTRNFTQLSKKGEVFLELENKENPFEAGLNILLRVGRGKYFDISSLSGGEKTLVALSLIFAIQEYKPYCFYIFDEIDAALDKHNSELLAALIKKYMLSGQYIVISHNDALITEASALFGVSMQENISKVISLKNE